MKRILCSAVLLATASLTLAEPATYVVEPTHTFVTYEISHFGTSTNRGRFDKKDGKVTLDLAAKTGKVDISFEIASVNTGVAMMDKHLQSDDFFSAEKFPKARFVGDKFSFSGDKVSSVSGMLTMRDKTHPVTLKAVGFNCYQNQMIKREVCGGDFEATIDRTQWDINYGLDWGFPKNVKLVIQVEAIKS
jgi:polyisoprenoid-binding protein YceI